MPDDVDSEFLRGHIVLIGDGEKGEKILSLLLERNLSVVVIDENRTNVESLRERKINAVCGEASDPAILIQAHIQDAALVIMAVENEITCRKIMETARLLNTKIEAIMPAGTDEEALRLKEENIAVSFVPDDLLAKAIVQFAMERYGRQEEEARITKESQEIKKALDRGAL